ncbi:MAG: DUF2252 family protein [Polyangiaceae bacterium]
MKRSDALHPGRLAERQLQLDQERLAPRRSWSREPSLRATARPLGADERAWAEITAEIERRKIARLSRSPLAFLRGSARLFYEMLSLVPSLGDGPLGTGTIVGDLHIENFGAYEPGPWKGPKGSEAPVFDVNDFDETFVGPLRWDLLRLVTSLLVGSRELGTTGPESIALAHGLFASYASAMFDGAPRPPDPPAVRSLLEQAGHRTDVDLAAPLVDASGRLRQSRRWLEPGPRIRSLVPQALEVYREGLGAEGPKAAQLEPMDVAFRIAGTGSLGCLRLGVLVRGKKEPWIFDMKEESPPSATAIMRLDRVEPAERVLSAMRTACVRAPALAGKTSIDGASMLVRRLAPENDKLDLTEVPKEELPELTKYLGALVGAAHARCVTDRGIAHRWTRGDTE